MGKVRTYRLLSILIPLLLLLVFRGMIGSRIERVREAHSLARHERQRIEDSGVRMRRLPELKADFESLARKKAEAASSLFPAASEASLYELLFVKSDEANATVASVSSLPKRRGPDYDEVPLRLQAIGTYNELSLLVNRIETSSRILHIENLNMSLNSKGELMAELEVTAYLQREDSSAAANRKNRLQPVTPQAYLDALQKALHVRMARQDFVYAPVANDPFAAAPARRSGIRTAASSRETPNVKLKGILWKQPPLAVLESLDGQTLILREGDEIGGYRVQSIARAAVSLIGPKGTHILEQYKQK